MKPSLPRSCRPWSFPRAFLEAACCFALAAGPARGQAGREANVPLDPMREQLNTELAIMVGLLSGGALASTACNILVANQNYQDYLRALELMKDDALLTAYTQAQMTDLQAQLRQATAASRYFVQKLEADLKYFEDQNFAVSMPTWTPRTGAESELQRRYRVVKAFLESHREPLTKAGEAVLALVPDVQKNLQGAGGYAMTGKGQDRLRLESGRVVDALVAYGKVMATAVDEYTRTVVVSNASPRRQLQMVLFNNSKWTRRPWQAADDNQAAAMFFVRIWERAADGSYPAPRSDTEGWLPVWPEGLDFEQVTKDEQTGRNVTNVVARLPNRLTLPVKLRDRVEVRAATFGLHRERVRFLPLDIGGSLRPDGMTFRRGFYYDGYSFTAPGGNKIISHWYATAEQYRWTFKGAWGPGNSARDPEFVTPASAEERERKYKAMLVESLYAKELTLDRDHVQWHLPASLDSVRDNNTGEAFVSGSATITRKGPTSDRYARYNESTTEAPLSFILDTW